MAWKRFSGCLPKVDIGPLLYYSQILFSVASDSPQTEHETPEQEVERLAERIGRLIRSLEPENREDLKELAFSLIREELIRGDEPQRGEAAKAPAPMNPMAAGALFFVLGAGLSFVFGPVGLALIIAGLIFIVWGAVISWIKGRK